MGSEIWRCLQAVRNKRGAAVKDVIPDECFLRLRGALFFGPGFLVTRNKLTFRDNLQELLTSATKSESAFYPGLLVGGFSRLERWLRSSQFRASLWSCSVQRRGSRTSSSRSG